MDSVKHDDGKPRIGLVFASFPRALERLARVSAYGAEVYGEGTWRSVPDARRRYHDAMARHLLALHKGEITDPESGSPHIAHVAWNALALCELYATWEAPRPPWTGGDK